MDYKEWAFHDVSPVYLQLYEKLTHSILNGQLCPCEDIPPIQSKWRLCLKSVQVRL
ncbi:hypothetical protein [Dorea formicigenerans]|uniref:hypothetical protein n=1 Tax=Dorea formicigenerans TaxID=39486 RepID=UPI003F667E32